MDFYFTDNKADNFQQLRKSKVCIIINTGFVCYDITARNGFIITNAEKVVKPKKKRNGSPFPPSRFMIK